MNTRQNTLSISYIKSNLEKIQDMTEKKNFIIHFAKEFNDVFINTFKNDVRAWKWQNSIKGMMDIINTYPECQALNFFISENTGFPMYPGEIEKEEIKILCFLKNEIIKIQNEIKSNEEKEENIFQDRLTGLSFDFEKINTVLHNEREEKAKEIINKLDSIGSIEEIKKRIYDCEFLGIDKDNEEEFLKLKSIKDNYIKAIEILNKPDTDKRNEKKEELNFFKAFNFNENKIEEFENFLSYLKKEKYIDFDENKLYSCDLQIKILKISHTLFGCVFYNFMVNKFMNDDIENQWITMSKFFTDKKGSHLNNIQLSNKYSDETKQSQVNNQKELLEGLYMSFQDDNE